MYYGCTFTPAGLSDVLLQNHFGDALDVFLDQHRCALDVAANDCVLDFFVISGCTGHV